MDASNDIAYVDGIAQETRITYLSEEQENAIRFVKEFLDGNDRYTVIGGVAGSGKSTIIPHIVNLCGEMFDINAHKGDAAICAYTGKAVMNLKRKGIVSAMTLHSFLYNTSYVKNDITGEIDVVQTLRPVSFYSGISLLVVDEASMLGEDMFKVISSLPFKTVYIGDHFQLPPVSGNFNIMLNPDFRLERIHRQEEGNPIVMLADMARNGKPIPLGSYGSSKHTRSLNRADLPGFDEVITWTNSMKDSVNDAIRSSMGYPLDIPQVGDKMIVRVNNRKKNVYNGQIVYIMTQPMRINAMNGNVAWHVEFIDELAYTDNFVMSCTDEYTKAIASVHLPKEKLEEIRKIPESVKSRKDFAKYKMKNPYDIHLDWGYAITCHAAQGTSWRNVAVIMEDRMKAVMDREEMNRWLYTAITRAEESVTIYSTNRSFL